MVDMLEEKKETVCECVCVCVCIPVVVSTEKALAPLDNLSHQERRKTGWVGLISVASLDTHLTQLLKTDT